MLSCRNKIERKKSPRLFRAFPRPPIWFKVGSFPWRSLINFECWGEGCRGLLFRTTRSKLMADHAQCDSHDPSIWWFSCTQSFQDSSIHCMLPVYVAALDGGFPNGRAVGRCRWVGCPQKRAIDTHGWTSEQAGRDSRRNSEMCDGHDSRNT